MGHSGDKLHDLAGRGSSKVGVSGAMRIRDVSRPRAEDSPEDSAGPADTGARRRPASRGQGASGRGGSPRPSS